MPTPEELYQTENTLRALPRGFLPANIFYALSERIVLPTIEVMVFHRTDDGVQVLLTQRPQSDPYWPEGWHLPGTVLLATDEEDSYDGAFKRIFQDELLDGVVLKSDPKWFTTKFWETGRGREVDQLYVAEYAEGGLPEEGKFYDLNNLPAGTLTHYQDIFQQGADHLFN